VGGEIGLKELEGFLYVGVGGVLLEEGVEKAHVVGLGPLLRGIVCRQHC